MLKIDVENKEIAYPIPLTANSGKIRVKERSILNEYGVPVTTSSTPFSQKHYIEWQIGYDVVWGYVNSKKEEIKVSNNKDLAKLNETLFPDIRFIGSNTKIKAIYELSEIAYLLIKWGIISKEEIENIAQYLANIDNNYLLDVHEDLRITRTNLKDKEILGFNFLETQVRFPLLIHKFGKYDIIAEIKITEKQRAIGVQPMLYFCFPITELKADLLGKTANPKQTADFVFNIDSKGVVLEMLKLFGILSKNHKQDVLEILKILRDVY